MANKKKSLHKDGNITHREMKLLAYNQDVNEGKMTLAEATVKSGYAVKMENAGAVGAKVLGAIKKKLSKNERFQEILGIKGASMEDAAQALADGLKATSLVRCEVTKATPLGVKEHPDNRNRIQTAIFLAEAHNAMPDKKIVTEHRTFEQKVHLIAEIKANPEASMEVIKKLLAEKGELPAIEGGDDD